MSTELAKQTDAISIAQNIDSMLSLGGTLVKSGFLPKEVKTAEAAVAIILKGQELGVPPMQAMSHIHIIGGKPTLSAELMLAMVMKAGHEVWVEEATEQQAVVKGRRAGTNRVLSEAFTMEDAKKAGLLSNNTWQKYPRAMLKARAISAFCRSFAPDVLMGASYTPEELGADVDADGEVIEVPVRPADADVAPQEAQEQASAGGAAPEGRTLSGAAAERLRTSLKQNGIPRDKQHRFVAAMVGRDVRVFTELSHEEATTVFNESARLKAEADAAEDAA